MKPVLSSKQPMLVTVRSISSDRGKILQLEVHGQKLRRATAMKKLLFCNEEEACDGDEEEACDGGRRR
ncbi:hypothetical protein ACOSQ2_017068 [Xanthoceras sorbifolium]